MTWLITHKPAYDTGFIDLPKNLQKQATRAHAELEQDPVTPRGNTIKKLSGVEADRLPKETGAADPQDIAEHHQAQRRLMYVGCTRAMRYLFVTYDRSIPSPFLQQLSEDCWLWL